jgi:hypothetical protein
MIAKSYGIRVSVIEAAEKVFDMGQEITVSAPFGAKVSPE